MTAIELTGLVKSYGRRIGVADLTFSVPAGSIFGFLGPNGSGKTTTIRVLLGLLRPDHGTAKVLGHDSWRESCILKRDVGYIPGDLRLDSWYTAERALNLYGLIRGQNVLPEGRRLVERFSLDPTTKVRSMSRGMRQKLGIILALAHRPQVLILDEPTSSLDPLMQAHFHDELRQLASEGHTIFLSSHTLHEVENLCDRIAILREGRLVAQDTIAGLRSAAPRRVTVRWSHSVSGNDIAAPPCIRLVNATARQWQALVTDGTVELVRWCSTQPIADLSIEQADLTGLFEAYYR
ncbi:MAG: ABC transporter ATP-binding protein [Planctomycetota bacterium]